MSIVFSMKESLVSIIIPAYKADNYITDALESVKNQLYQSWELIVVEDAWRDKTEEIVADFSYTVGQDRVKFIRHPENRGLGATRNTGIKLASGKYIALLDHDDIWEPTHLQESVRLLEAEQADIAYSTAVMFDDTGKELGYWGPEEEEIKNFPASLHSRNYITPSTTVINKSSLEKVGCFDEIIDEIHGCEDYDLWIRMAIAKCHFVYVAGKQCLYRKHSTAMTANHKIMAERELYVMKKHKNWAIIPKELSRQRTAELYNQVAELSINDKPWDTVKFFIFAWWNQPKNFYYAKRAVKTIISQFPI